MQLNVTTPEKTPAERRKSGGYNNNLNAQQMQPKLDKGTGQMSTRYIFFVLIVLTVAMLFAAQLLAQGRL